MTPGTPCRQIVCGDGAQEGDEQCDDGNTNPGDGCDANCLIETLCPDGIVAGTEQCDDGNAVAGDGCDASCQLEPGWHCPTPGAACVPAYCGDGLVQGLEECDDAGICSGGSDDNPTNGQTCTLDGDCVGGTTNGTCQRLVCIGGTNDGTTCTTDGDCLGGGTCSDATNMLDGDGCAADCTEEPSFVCEGDPSVCEQRVKWVEIRTFNVSNVAPDALHSHPETRSFVGYKLSDAQEPIELCIDGTMLVPSSDQLCLPGQTYGSNCEDGTSLVPRYRPVGGALSGATYDPFTNSWLFINGDELTRADLNDTVCVSDNTTPCVDRARSIVEDSGYEVLVFHATGIGGKTTESLITDGYVAASLDITTTELADEVCGGVFSAGPERCLPASRW